MTKYYSGDHNAYCQVCGFRYRASELRRRWDGLLVCNDDFESKHDADMRDPHRIPKESLPSWVRNSEPIGTQFLGLGPLQADIGRAGYNWAG